MTENPNHDITGNAPLIPRSELIRIKNELTLTLLAINNILDQYAPEHFKETKAGQPKISETVWSQSTTGLPSESLVHTVTT